MVDFGSGVSDGVGVTIGLGHNHDIREVLASCPLLKGFFYHGVHLPRVWSPLRALLADRSGARHQISASSRQTPAEESLLSACGLSALRRLATRSQTLGKQVCTLHGMSGVCRFIIIISAFVASSLWQSPANAWTGPTCGNQLFVLAYYSST